MKYLFGLLLFLGFGAIGYFGYQHYQVIYQKNQDLGVELTLKKQEIDRLIVFEEENVVLEKKLREKEDKERIYTLLVGGDVMMDRGVKGRIRTLGEDYNFSFDLIRDDFNKVDYVFANLEGSISDVGADTGKPYSFRFEPAVASALAKGGIDSVSLANNHMLDWGRKSLCATTGHLDQVGITYVGGGCNAKIAERPLIKEFGNTKVGFLAYTEFYQGAHAVGNTPGMSKYDFDHIQDTITRLEEDVDIVIVSMHWGAEYKHRATDAQVEIGQKIIDMGADIIVGHHPHVDQEIERYGDGWIIYSLGNLIFDQSWSEETMQGILGEIQIQDGAVRDIIPIPIQLNKNYQPYIIR